ncbi:RHS repeat-associated core domain-containing protein [Nitrosospira briensis]|uniref:RHS repeat-associated core domain-containing protein n=1 Tax=Nitrosospira briensis TaxID=35799 RepID=A0A1I4XFV8_9PROT|nr:SpvB/TcaC N-terminal domain-containing protein [Nitrosospira briensis]SFN24798.1 RHS repeat-associated core domain-containing protein [Nitrosospira briensis]
MEHPAGAETRKENEASAKGAPWQSAPTIALPKGGGAIRGMGEKFAANPVTGTSSMSIPIVTSPGRSGFEPQLSISYDSGAGNGTFGFGWSLSLPSITRKTDKGLPKYRDTEESDIFILSGAEDLVPCLVESDGRWRPESLPTRTVDAKSYHIKRYRPRIDGLFARIERWTNQSDPSDTFWRSITRDNLTTWYGKTPESRIADAADSARIFTWLICESYDDKGNVMAYRYKEENSDNIDLCLANERNRTSQSRSANRYLKHIQYGNRTPYHPTLKENEPLVPLPSDWLFEVVFDYGEHDEGSPMPSGNAGWLSRADAFSTYRAGFEVRTYRLCQRVLMFHHFPEEPGVGANCLVRSTDFTYSHEENPTDAHNPIFSFLLSVTQSGYKRLENDLYLKKSLPPLEFGYTKPRICREIQEVDPESLENLPYGLDGSRYQWVDLDGEGLSSILTEQGDEWFYKPNLSPINVQTCQGEERVTARFGPVEMVAKKPSLAALNSGRQQLLDLAGDGRLDLVELVGPTPGFYERTHDEDWDKFEPFTSLPVLDWSNPNLKFVDLTGDGHADILITEDHAFCWHASLAEAGFGSSQRVHQMLDEEKGARLVFADGTDSIFLADLSGDGLTDLLRVRNGEVCYWPNLGYGRFGTKVRMDNAPWFEAPDLFDPRRIRLADIDGSGVTDVIYLGRDSIRLYFNQSGNSWSKPVKLVPFPATDNLATIQVADLLGNGTACLIWSSPLPIETRRSMRYVDLMGGQKPHLLIKTANNLGAETHVRYAPSTRFYLADKLSGKPWITKIPFPVHVVERVETYDRISRNRFVTRYAYHHGYFDGIEREFRGFGMVEQWDTEDFAAFSASSTFPNATNIDAVSHLPPVLTKTWFHTGVYREVGEISKHFEEEYWLESSLDEGNVRRLDVELAKSMLLDDIVLPKTIRCRNEKHVAVSLSEEEKREACRALKGSILRQEIYALDETEEACSPYRISERNYTIEFLQPHGKNKFAVFFTHARETVDFHYERKLYPIEVEGCHYRLADPRVSHTITLSVDDYGNVLQSVAVGYGRRHGELENGFKEEDREKQRRMHITYSENRFTNAISQDEGYRTPLPCESRTFELLKAMPTADLPHITNLFRFDEMVQLVAAACDGAHDIPYEDVYATFATDKHPYRRFIEQMRSLYIRDDLTRPLPLGGLEPMALPYESYKLAFTPGLLSDVYGARVTDAMLENDGRYVHNEGDCNWWIPSGRMFLSPESADTPAEELAFARQHFFLPHRYRNPFHTEEVPTESFVRYDTYNLLMQETRDALANRVTVGERDPDGNLIKQGNDYRVLQPRLIMDPNRNRTEVAFDALGMVVGTAVMGKLEETLGDSLEGFEVDLSDEVVLDHLSNPGVDPHSILNRATTRLVYDLFAYQRTRNEPDLQSAMVYTLARETHVADLPEGRKTKIQHSFSYSDGFGREIQKKIQAEPGQVDGVHTVTRWVGSGWTIFNNKGKSVRQYEPFFSNTHRFEFAKQQGVSPILFYDPIERVVATLHPNRTWEKVVFDPWRQETWDVNDTVLLDPDADTEVQGFFRALPATDYLPTWHQERINLPQGDLERQAAEKTSHHANTPTLAYFDALGRPFLSIADNGPTGKYATRTELDIESNQRAVVDAKDRLVMRYDYDMLGNRIHQASMEAGERWMLNDVVGKPVRAWNSRGHRFRTEYDPLRRPLGLFVVDTDANDVSREILYQRTAYGEEQGEAHNHRTRVFQVFDGAGVVTSEAYDFKGNLLHSKRQLVQNYKHTPDWCQQPELEDETFVSLNGYDALNRPITLTTPDKSLIQPAYNEANLLEKLQVNLRGTETATWFVTNINYNAKGQRERIEHGNGTRTEYAYDEKTFRLTTLKTLRRNTRLQDLSYTYDPAGNITHIRDEAQQTIFFRNRQVEPSTDYVYDAIYRLIQATGREHLGQSANGCPFGPVPTSHSDQSRVGLLHPGDGQAMGIYRESYEYDEVGNFLRLLHHGTNPHHAGWKREYQYKELSLLDPGQNSNRLSDTRVGETTETYAYDIHGNMLQLPHLAEMAWDFKDQLRAVGLGGGGRAYYVYDASGQRVRKVHEHNGSTVEERIYLGGFEIYRKRKCGEITLTRETLHIMDDKQRIALVETKTQDADACDDLLSPIIRYQLGNHLGSANLELDFEGGVISYEEYYPYGSTSYQAGRSVSEVSLKRYRYTGKEHDEESGLYYHSVRYYAPWLGRWTNCDPIGIKGGLNYYTYCDNNPINRTDTAGTDWEWCNPFNDSDCGVGSTAKVFAEQASDVATGVWLAGKEAVVGVKDLAVGAFNVSLIGMLVDREQWEESNRKLEQVVSTIVDNPGVVWEAVKEPYVKAWEEGRPGEAIGRGLFEIVNIVAGTKGVDKVAKGSKLGAVATKVDDATKVANRVDDVANLANKAKEAGKATAELFSKRPASFDPMPEGQFKRIQEAFKRQGKVIDNSEDALRYLETRGAEGVTFNAETILVRPGASPSTVFEELIHATQHRTGRFAEWTRKYGNAGAEAMAEYEAAKRLVKNRSAYGISDAENAINVSRVKQFEADLKTLGVPYE